MTEDEREAAVLAWECSERIWATWQAHWIAPLSVPGWVFGPGAEDGFPRAIRVAQPLVMH